MKKVFLAFLLLASITMSSMAQKLLGQEIVVEDNISQATHWEKLNLWVSRTFDNYRATVDYQNPHTGEMIIKGSTPLDLSLSAEHFNFVKFHLTFALEIDCKDNKYRAYFRNIACKAESTNGDVSFMTTELLKMVKADLEAIIDISYKEGTTWNINEAFFKEMKRLEDLCTETKKKSEDMSLKKKERKNNEKLYEKYYKKHEIYSSVRLHASLLTWNIMRSLKASMERTDNF